MAALVYECRFCETRFAFGKNIDIGYAKEILTEYVYSSLLDKKNNQVLTMTLHECNSGNYGISDLIGISQDFS